MFYNKDIDLTEVFKDDINKFVGECQPKDIDDIIDVYEAIGMFLDYVSEQIEEEFKKLVNDLDDITPTLGKFSEVKRMEDNILSSKPGIMLNIAESYREL